MITNLNLTKIILSFIQTSTLITILSTLPSSAQPHMVVTTKKETTKLTITSYKKTTMQGWTIYVEKTAYHHPEIKDTLKNIEAQLAGIKNIIKPEIVTKLQLVTIWLNKDIRNGACYHPSIQWLKQNKRMPEKARSIEIESINSFMRATKSQPMVMLHELSHAFHHRIHNFNHPAITKAFKKAVAAKSYEKVKHVNGTTVRHYALTNEKEYFAETTEAYFGKNDFYPFNKKELKKHDPNAYAMIESIWEIKK